MGSDEVIPDTCPTVIVSHRDTLSQASPAGVSVAAHEGKFGAVSVNSICVTSRHTSEWAQSVVYHAGSRRNAHRENEDKGGKETEESWQSARTEKGSNIIIHRA